MAKIDYLFSLMEPADHAVYTPHLTAVSCTDRDYLVRLNAEIFDIDLEEASGFVNSSLDDDRCKAWLICGRDAQKPLPPAGSIPTHDPTDGLTVIGCVILYCTPTYASMAGFGLLAEYRGRGLSIESLDLICGKLPQTVKRMDAHTDSENPTACSLYQKYGFVILEELPS